MKAIILAGGLGTRLRPVIGDNLPKCMAPIMGKPMINYTINRIKKFGITDITLALGYKSESFLSKYSHMKYKIEETPLGTGGAIKNCLEARDPVLVVNGDTFTAIDYSDMLQKHIHPLTIAVNENGESAGTYILDPEILDNFHGAFSFEKDVIPVTPFSTYTTPWFIDYGVPESYGSACKDWI